MAVPYQIGDLASALKDIASGKKIVEVYPRPTGGYVLQVVDKTR